MPGTEKDFFEAYKREWHSLFWRLWIQKVKNKKKLKKYILLPKALKQGYFLPGSSASEEGAFCLSRGHFRIPRVSLNGLWKRETIRGLVKWGNPIKYVRASLVEQGELSSCEL